MTEKKAPAAKRIAALFLSLAIAVTAAQTNDALSIPAAAEEPVTAAEQTVSYMQDEPEISEPDAAAYTEAGTADAVRRMLSENQDAYIRLSADIYDCIGTPGDPTGGITYQPYWCVMGTGKKVLDLNGHTFRIQYDLNFDSNDTDKRRNTDAFKGSTLLKAGTGVNFELYDSVGGGEITYDAMLSDKPGTFYMDIRNILEVNGGTFTMNGGYIHAGRKELFKARDGKRTRLVNGNAIIVGPKSSIYIHAGKIESTGSYFWHELPEHKLNTIEVFDNYAQACAGLNLSMYSHASEYYGVEELMADSSTTVVIDDCEMVSLDSLCYRTMLNVKENLIIRGGSFSALVNRKFVYYGNSASEDIYAYSFAYSGLPLKALDLDKYKIWVGDAIHTNHYTVKAHYITKEETESADAENYLFWKNDKRVKPDVCVTPLDKYYPTMYERVNGSTSDKNMTLTIPTWNTADNIIFYAHFGGQETNSVTQSVWPDPYPSIYPTGEGAPKHEITYIWKIYDSTGDQQISEAVVHKNSNIFNPRTEVKPINLAKLEDDKTYIVKCEITETYEGTNSYTASALSTGRFKVVPYVPAIDVKFTTYVREGDGGLDIDLTGDCTKSHLDYLVKKGTIGAYKYIVTNETTGKTLPCNPYDTKLVVLESDLLKAGAGVFDLSVEIVLYKDTEKTNQITTAGQIKKTQEAWWLPKVTCPDDKDGDGKVTLANNGSTQIKFGDFASINADEFGITDGIKYPPIESQSQRFMTINKSNGSGEYTLYCKKDDNTYWAPNKIKITFEDPNYTWTTNVNIPHRNINTTTVFDSTDKLSATVTVSGKTLTKQPKMVWSVICKNDDIVRYAPIGNRKQATTVTEITKGSVYRCDMLLKDVILSYLKPQDFPEGDVTFRCLMYESSYNDDPTAYVDVTVNFTIGYSEVHLWAMRGGKMTDVTNSYIYVDDEDGYVDIEVRGNDVFKNLGAIDTYHLGNGFKSDHIESNMEKSVMLEQKDVNGQQVFSYWTYYYGDAEVTLCHPVTEYKVDGVETPQLGKRLDSIKAYVPDGANYTAKVGWLVNGNSAPDGSEVFEPNKVYTAMVSIIPGDGVVLPVLDEQYQYVDGSRINVQAKYNGKYSSVPLDKIWGFPPNTYIGENQLPVADGTKTYAYTFEYLTFERMPDESAEYIDSFNITFDVPRDGDKKADFRLTFDPDEPLNTYTTVDGKEYQHFTSSVKRESDGSTSFDKFEAGKWYTVTINVLSTNITGIKKYHFADTVSVYVNGSKLSGDAVKLNTYNNDNIQSITFRFRAVQEQQVIESFGFDIPIPAVGKTLKGDNKPITKDKDLYGWYEWFEDKNKNGAADTGEFVSSEAVEEGKIYGVRIKTNAFGKYKFADTVTITCNDVNKTATFDGGYAYADFILIDGKPCTHESMTLVEAVESNCKVQGHIAYYVCDKCGKWFETDKTTEITDHESVKLPLGKHTADDPVKENEAAAKCDTYGGYDEVWYCKICGEEILRTTHILPALGHDWSDWKISVEPTEGTEGVESRRCSRCDLVETRSLPYLGFPVTIGTGKDFETIADAIKQINKDIKNKTAKPNGYNFIIADTHTEKKAITLPKESIKFAITGGKLILNSPTITANSNLVIYGEIVSAKDTKPITIKAAAGKTVNILKLNTNSTLTLSGNKTNNFLLNTGTTLNIVNVNATNVNIGEGTTVKLGAKSKFTPAELTGSGTVEASDTAALTLPSVKQTGIILNEYAAKSGAVMPKLIIGNAEGITLTVKAPNGEIADINGKQIFTLQKDSPYVYLKGVTITNPSGANTLSAVPYKKIVRAEWLGALTLVTDKGNEYFPSFEKAFAAVNDLSVQYIIEMNCDMSVSKLVLPAKAYTLMIKGNEHTIAVDGAIALNAKCKFMLSDVVLKAEKGGKTQNITITGQDITAFFNVKFTGAAVNIKGKDGVAVADCTGTITSITGFSEADIKGTLTIAKTITVPTIRLAPAANLILAKGASVTAKTELSGQKDCAITLMSGFKPLSFGKATGEIKLIPSGISGTVQVFATKQALDDLKTVFTVTGGELIAGKSGKTDLKIS